METSMPSDESDLLFHLSLNAEAPETILLVHGAFSSSSGWDLVFPLLSQHYHLLIPDLPGHGRSATVQPFNLSNSSKLLADLIRSRAHTSKAHVVGFSLGSVIAADLASHYPDLVDTVLVSGFLRLSPSFTTSLLPYFFQLEHGIASILPRSVLRYVMDGADIQPTARPSKLCREVCAFMVTDAPLAPITARTLVIAATKGGLIPSNDSIEDARKLFEAAKKGNLHSRAVQHRGMRHPWDRQNPALFVETVRAWIEDLELPSGFEGL